MSAIKYKLHINQLVYIIVNTSFILFKTQQWLKKNEKNQK
ncbi:hypothetical protein K661_02792 [Piscirickettsia salmonis LF-89 = ATCC VR-1361]|nr:hypothetical protein K661_02792 [Piscirickettsia salmonis LF-89 = ATCC VR-1361]